MPFVVLLSGAEPVTLHLTSEPVILVPGVPVEVPEGYRAVLVNRDLTRPHVVVDADPEPAAPEPEPTQPPAPAGGSSFPPKPAPRGRKPKEG